jgi:hypothetical protein
MDRCVLVIVKTVSAFGHVTHWPQKKGHRAELGTRTKVVESPARRRVTPAGQTDCR